MECTYRRRNDRVLCRYKRRGQLTQHDVVRAIRSSEWELALARALLGKESDYECTYHGGDERECVVPKDAVSQYELNVAGAGVVYLRSNEKKRPVDAQMRKE